MSARRLAQAGSVAVLAAIAAAILFGVVRVGGLLIAAQTAVATEPQVGLPEVLPLPDATWVPGSEPPIEPTGGSDALLRGYSEAWAELSLAHATLRLDRLDRFFADPALGHLRRVLESRTTPVEITDGAHVLEVVAVHPEGWLVTFVDRDIEVERQIGGVGIVTRETYEVTMVLTRGRWLVRSMVRVDVEG